MRAPSKILALLICTAGMSPRLPAEDPVPAQTAIDIASIPEREWELPKDTAHYEITSDVWFARIEAFSKTKPKFPPGTGIGDGGGGNFAKVIFIPETAGERSRRAFEVYLPYSWTGSSPRAGDTFEMKRFSLEERVTEGDTIRYRTIGGYMDITMLAQIRTEVLRRSYARKKLLMTKAPNGKWHVENTRCQDADIGEPLPEDLKALLGKPSSPGKPDDPKPWSAIWFYPATVAPSRRKEGDLKSHRVDVYRDGRMKIHELTEKLEGNISRDLGWFKSLDQWNKLRLMIVGDIKKRQDEQESR